MVNLFFCATKKGVEPDLFIGREQGGNPSFPSYSLLKKIRSVVAMKIVFTIYIYIW